MMDVRTTLERITRGWRFKRTLPAAFGHAPLWVSPGGRLGYLLKPMAAVDPALLGLVQEFVKPSDCVWDVGANVGLFSVAAAHVAGAQGAVMSFEPDTWLVQLLRRSAALQPDRAAPINIVPAAVADTINLRAFCVAKRARSANYLAEYGYWQTGGVQESQTVISVNLDWLAERLRAPQLIKIDVEGAELEVLRGANSVLGSQRPYILCEVGSQASEAVGELLRAHNYLICDGSLPSNQRTPLTDAPWSTVAIPAEKRAKEHLTRAHS